PEPFRLLDAIDRALDVAERRDDDRTAAPGGSHVAWSVVPLAEVFVSESVCRAQRRASMRSELEDHRARRDRDARTRRRQRVEPDVELVVVVAVDPHPGAREQTYHLAKANPRSGGSVAVEPGRESGGHSAERARSKDPVGERALVPDR